MPNKPKGFLLRWAARLWGLIDGSRRTVLNLVWLALLIGVPVALITGAHLAISEAMNAAVLAGVEAGSGSTPSFSRSAWKEGICITLAMADCSVSITAAGVPAGASRMPEVAATMPGRLNSTAAGMSGAMGERFAPVVASTRNCPCRW